MLLHIEENQVYVNGETHYRCNDSEIYQTRYQTTSELYRACVKMHGRCTGKVYIGEGTQVGWIFLKKNTESERGSKPKGCFETWVTVYAKPPVKVVKWEGAEYPAFARKRSHRMIPQQASI